MKACLDTSALIRAARLGIVPEGTTRAHSVAEFYCVLTGPGIVVLREGKTVKVRLAPAEARTAALKTFARVSWRDVSGREALAALEPAVKSNLAGKLIHDYMHAEAAALAECDAVMTLNAKDFVRLVPKRIKVVAPAEYFAAKD